MLGVDHLTLEGGGGAGAGWVILKKNFLHALVGRKKIACSTNVIEKKLLRCCKKEKKKVAKLFHHSRGL